MACQSIETALLMFKTHTRIFLICMQKFYTVGNFIAHVFFASQNFKSEQWRSVESLFTTNGISKWQWVDPAKCYQISWAEYWPLDNIYSFLLQLLSREYDEIGDKGLITGGHCDTHNGNEGSLTGGNRRWYRTSSSRIWWVHQIQQDIFKSILGTFT